MISLRVHGQPAPQGSKTAVSRGGRAWVIEGGSKTGRAKHAAWRQAVAAAAQEHLSGGGEPLVDSEPLVVWCVFVMPRPSSAPKRRFWHSTKPDIDKLLRSTLDGLTDGGLLAHDSRVSVALVCKRLAGPGEPCGAFVTVDVADPADELFELSAEAMRRQGVA